MARLPEVRFATPKNAMAAARQASLAARMVRNSSKSEQEGSLAGSEVASALRDQYATQKQAMPDDVRLLTDRLDRISRLKADVSSVSGVTRNRGIVSGNNVFDLYALDAEEAKTLAELRGRTRNVRTAEAQLAFEKATSQRDNAAFVAERNRLGLRMDRSINQFKVIQAQAQALGSIYNADAQGTAAELQRSTAPFIRDRARSESETAAEQTVTQRANTRSTNALADGREDANRRAEEVAPFIRRQLEAAAEKEEQAVRSEEERTTLLQTQIDLANDLHDPTVNEALAKAATAEHAQTLKFLEANAAELSQREMIDEKKRLEAMGPLTQGQLLTIINDPTSTMREVRTAKTLHAGRPAETAAQVNADRAERDAAEETMINQIMTNMSPADAEAFDKEGIVPVHLRDGYSAEVDFHNFRTAARRVLQVEVDKEKAAAELTKANNDNAGDAADRNAANAVQQMRTYGAKLGPLVDAAQKDFDQRIEGARMEGALFEDREITLPGGATIMQGEFIRQGNLIRKEWQDRSDSERTKDLEVAAVRTKFENVTDGLNIISDHTHLPVPDGVQNALARVQQSLDVGDKAGADATMLEVLDLAEDWYIPLAGNDARMKAGMIELSTGIISTDSIMALTSGNFFLNSGSMSKFKYQNPVVNQALGVILPDVTAYDNESDYINATYEGIGMGVKEVAQIVSRDGETFTENVSILTVTDRDRYQRKTAEIASVLIRPMFERLSPVMALEFKNLTANQLAMADKLNPNTVSAELRTDINDVLVPALAMVRDEQDFHTWLELASTVDQRHGNEMELGGIVRSTISSVSQSGQDFFDGMNRGNGTGLMAMVLRGHEVPVDGMEISQISTAMTQTMHGMLFNTYRDLYPGYASRNAAELLEVDQSQRRLSGDRTRDEPEQDLLFGLPADRLGGGQFQAGGSNTINLPDEFNVNSFYTEKLDRLFLEIKN